jgi:dihydrodipicolinate synthase/N-acetylneuraminate lyase
MSLPEPTPIVQMYQAVDDDPIPDEDDDEAEKAKRWARILKILKMLFVALALAGTIAFGALKGCAGLLAAPLVPHDEEQQEQTTHQTQTEDERGVAVAG